MKAIQSIPALTLAVAIGLSGLAAAEPAQTGQNAPAQYNPKELQVDKIQSQPSPASTGDQPEMQARNSAGGQQGQIMQDYYAHSNATSPQSNNYASIEFATVKEAAPTPQQPKGFSLSSSTPGSTVVATPPGAGEQSIGGAGNPQSNNSLVNYENIPAGQVFTNDCLDCYQKIDAKPSAGEQWAGGSDDGSSIRTKQPRRRSNGTRGRRIHKP